MNEQQMLGLAVIFVMIVIGSILVHYTGMKAREEKRRNEKPKE